MCAVKTPKNAYFGVFRFTAYHLPQIFNIDCPQSTSCSVYYLAWYFLAISLSDLFDLGLGTCLSHYLAKHDDLYHRAKSHVCLSDDSAPAEAK